MKTLKYIFLFACSLFSADLLAQYNPSVMFSEHFQTQRARFEPSYLGTTSNDGQIEINVVPAYLNFHVWTGNSFVGAETVRGFINGGVTGADVENAIEGLGDNNRLNFGVHSQILAVAVKIPRTSYDFENDTQAQEDFLTVSFEVNERVEGVLSFPKELAELAWYGNGRFNNQALALENFSLNGFWIREYALGGAMNITEFGDFKLRAGLRLKYIQGMAGSYTESGSKVTLTTSEERLTLAPDYTVNIGGIPRDGEDFNTSSKGGGFGIDLGGTLTYQDNLKLSLNVLDIGSVNFRTDVRNYTNNSQVNFEGFEITTAGLSTSENLLDSLGGELEGTETNNSFRMPLPTRLSLQAEYTLPAGVDNTHKFFFNYTQGFRDMGAATTRPLISLAYVYSIQEKINLGLAPTFLGVNSAGLGFFTSMKFGVFKFGIGSANIITLGSGLNAGRLIDLSFNLGVSF